VVAPDELAEGVCQGDRRSLARAITVVESTRADHRRDAAALLDRLVATTTSTTSHRVGISGAPGVGKSTLLETLGMLLVERGHKVAVLAIDPSSRRTGGSILGDKTRMERLSRHPDAYIRPSPSGGTLGGVARNTREAMIICEAAGFDVVLVETVGVGQSETAVASMVDTFVLLLSPAGGDDLQGVKRGIVELADVIAVNKVDGDLRAAGERTVADYAGAAQYLRPRHREWTPSVLGCSAAAGEGVAELWAQVQAHRAALDGSGALDELRADQRVEWLWSEIVETVTDRMRADPALSEALDASAADVRSGRRPPNAAALDIVTRLFATG
jgi:LAO/AO transport system kinase